jgi:hypothetical protein
MQRYPVASKRDILAPGVPQEDELSAARQVLQQKRKEMSQPDVVEALQIEWPRSASHRPARLAAHQIMEWRPAKDPDFVLWHHVLASQQL